jgi:hypothetical protein
MDADMNKRAKAKGKRDNHRAVQIPNCPPHCSIYHTIDQAGAILNLDRSGVYELMNERDQGRPGLRYTFTKAGGTRRIHHHWIDEYMRTLIPPRPEQSSKQSASP